MPNDHNPPGGISTRLISPSADSADPPEGQRLRQHRRRLHGRERDQPCQRVLRAARDAGPRRDVTGRRILDAGCSSGPLFAALRDRGANVTGIDASARMLTRPVGGWAPKRTCSRRSSQATAVCRRHVRRRRRITGAALPARLGTDAERTATRADPLGGRLIISVDHPSAHLPHGPHGRGQDKLFSDASYPRTEEWTMGGQTAQLTFWDRPLHAMTDAFTAAGFQIKVIS